MSYVGEPFEHDIFVSYSHGDPEGTGQSKIKQWSRAFASELESEFRGHPKLGPVKIFLDQHHRPSQGIDPLAPLTEQLQSEIGRSAILAVLMSPHYLTSKWCGDERDWWFKKQSELGLPVDGRAAVARIWPTDTDWPKELTDSRGEQLPGFYFYDRNKAGLFPRLFGYPVPTSNTGDPFREELLKLAGGIGLKLEELRQIVEERRLAQADAAKLAAISGQVVYLHGRIEFASAWERAANALSSVGLAVVPGEPDPVVSDPKASQEISRLRVEAMSGCDALLLVGPNNGRVVDADLALIGRQDRNSARARSNKLLPCALLDSAGPAIATPTRKLTAKHLDVEWIDATAHPWTPAVQQWLSKAGANR